METLKQFIEKNPDKQVQVLSDDTKRNFRIIPCEPRIEGDTIIWCETEPLSDEEKLKLLSKQRSLVLLRRKYIMDNLAWRHQRAERLNRLGLPPVDNTLEQLDTYMQALADITKQADYPWVVEWPVLSSIT